MENLLPGWHWALNHHPAFVHFPIVLWLAALVFEAAAVWERSDSTHHVATWLLYLGTLAAPFAIATGINAGNAVPAGPAAHALEVHEELMLTSFFIAVGLCAFAWFGRRQPLHSLKVVLLVGLLLLGFCLTIGADRGAEMVYHYGLGVNRPAAVQQRK
jgi:uncharacterized membrane protein